MKERRFQQRHRLSPAAKDSLQRRLRERIEECADVVFAYAHGSFVKETAFCDLDVGVYAAADVDALHLESDLSLEMSEATGFPVELRVINGAPVAFQMAVLRDGRLLVCRSEDLLTDFIEEVGRRYRTYRHFRDLFLAA